MCIANAHIDAPSTNIQVIGSFRLVLAINWAVKFFYGLFLKELGPWQDNCKSVSRTFQEFFHSRPQM